LTVGDVGEASETLSGALEFNSERGFSFSLAKAGCRVVSHCLNDFCVAEANCPTDFWVAETNCEASVVALWGLLNQIRPPKTAAATTAKLHSQTTRRNPNRRDCREPAATVARFVRKPRIFCAICPKALRTPSWEAAAVPETPLSEAETALDSAA
jgi:hypothetical protein